MFTKIVVLAAYFAMVILLGFLARGRLSEKPSQYFLAGRGLKGFVLVGTIAATNFSAFTVFGASGAGYRDGLAFFPIMGFGTGFMAVTFWLLGRRIWEMGRKHELVTPAELIQVIYGNKWLSALFALVMVFFTVPYLALQPLAGSKVLGGLFGMPTWAGAGLVTLIIMGYTLRGGLKAVAWTDVLQGFLMLFLLIAAIFMVAGHHGGWTATFKKALATDSSLFSRPGPRGMYTPFMFFSFIFLWFFCDPMFPQLFQRFYSAKTKKDLAKSAVWYPIICTSVFCLPIGLGVLGRLSFPELAGSTSDNIMPLLMTEVAGEFMGTLVLAAGLAALMSTMDSQLLTLGSIFSRDLWPLITGKQVTTGGQSRIFVFALALAGLAVALNADTTILQLGITAFTGLAVLFPCVFFGLILKNPHPKAALVSILVGELFVGLYHFKLLPSFGFLPAVPVIVVSLASYLAVQIASGGLKTQGVKKAELMFLAGFGAIFILSQDFWQWGQVGNLYLGWPGWAWYFVFLSLAQFGLTWWWVKNTLAEPLFAESTVKQGLTDGASMGLGK